MAEQLTYDQIVEHIVQSKAIPNVVRVPDIVLDDSLRSQSTMRPRYKPWESPQPLGGSSGSNVGGSSTQEAAQPQEQPRDGQNASSAQE